VGRRRGGRVAASSARWLADLAAGVAAGPDPVAARARALGGVVRAVAGAAGVALPPLQLLERWGPPADVALPAEDCAPGVVPRATEALLPRAERRRLGAYATPPVVAAELVGRALAASPSHAPSVFDPAAGGGALLLAAAGAGVDLLAGLDLDPVAAAAATAALCLQTGGRAVHEVATGDALDPGRWPVRPDVVVGNPPFRSPLRGGGPGRDRRLGPYADVATAFLLRSLDEVAPGGVVALLLPASFLSARDAAPARRLAGERAELVDVWRPPVRFAGAAVHVCAVVLRAGTGTAPPGSWSPLVAGAPDVPVVPHGRVGDRFEVAADFRAQYYALAPHVVEGPGGADPARFPPLVTSGLVDPAECAWGRRPARHGRRRWDAPRVDLDGLAAAGHGAWAGRRLVPKVVVATQTRVVEAAVDETGAWLPSVPLVSVTGPPDRLWHAAAALLCPVITAGALRRAAGAALDPDHIKLGAPQVRSLPLPAEGADWDVAADAVRAATAAGTATDRRRALLAAATASCAAYGVPAGGLVEWWAARLPTE
jgi:hypothetical protein